jgi:hypothetical protein
MVFKYLVKKHVKKGYDGVDVMRWNPKLEPFVAQ